MKFSRNLPERLVQLRSLSAQQQSSILQSLTRLLPAEHAPWPFGMPSSVAPYIVVVGLSPGSSPAASGQPTSSTGVGTYDPPTFGDVHQGFLYPDPRNYWDKIQVLCKAVVRQHAPTLSLDDCLALSGHYNLGTGLFGEASMDAVEPEIVSWLSGLVNLVLPARVIVCLGLNSILASHKCNRLWNGAPNALSIDWRNPQFSYPFQRYQFRVWETRRSDGEEILVCVWPNHPSRHPFAGTAENVNWLSSVTAFCNILDKHGF